MANRRRVVERSVVSPAVDTVIVLHGMGRTKLSMTRLAAHLSAQCYKVVNLAYPSTRQSIAESTVHLKMELMKLRLNPAGRI